MKVALHSVLAAAAALAALTTQAAVVPIDGASPVFFGVSPVTFNEAALGTTNPTIGTVSFGSFYAGQSLGNIFTCGGTISNCVLGSPTGPLSLASSPLGLGTTIVSDSAHVNSPVLSGSPDFTRGDPIAMLFSDDVSAVSFLAGAFNSLANTRVRAYSRTGSLLAESLNPQDDFFTFGFGSTDTNGNAFNAIAGLLISQIGFETNGFSIDNLRTVVTPIGGGGGQAPEPTSPALVGLALFGVWSARRCCVGRHFVTAPRS